MGAWPGATSVHNCIGRPLATIKLQEALADSSPRFEHLRLAGDVTWKQQVTRSTHHLP